MPEHSGCFGQGGPGLKVRGLILFRMYHGTILEKLVLRLLEGVTLEGVRGWGLLGFWKILGLDAFENLLLRTNQVNSGNFLQSRDTVMKS